MRKERWVEAEQTLRKAISKGEELSCVPYLLDAYLAMGDLYLTQGNLEKATYHYKMVIAKPHGYKEKERQAWFQLAKYGRVVMRRNLNGVQKICLN